MNSMKIYLLMLVAVLSVALVACGSDESASQPVGDAMVENGDAMMENGDAMMENGDVSSSIAGFRLDSLSVKVGTTITWTNDHSAPHTISYQVTNSDPPQTGDLFDSATLSTGDQFAYTFSQPGTFQFYCKLHPGSMRGTITVEAG